MGLFPTDAEDGDEVTNTGGTTFKYVAADDKWIIINTLTISDLIYNAVNWNNNPDAATKNAIRDKIELLVALIAANCTVAEAIQAVEDTGLVLSQDSTISFDAEQNDTTYSGICIDIDTTGCNLFDLVYVDGVDSVAPADADAIGTMPSIGIVVATGKVLTHGTVKDDDLIKCTTGGAIVYASTTLREVQEAIPNGVGDVVQIVGVCVGDHTLFVNPSLDWVVRQ